MVLCASTYVTVVLALERYKAVWRPVEYRNSVLSGNPWRRVFIYIAPVVIFSVLFNIPKVNYHQHLTLFYLSIVSQKQLLCRLSYSLFTVLWDWVCNNNHTQCNSLWWNFEPDCLRQSDHGRTSSLKIKAKFNVCCS